MMVSIFSVHKNNQQSFPTKMSNRAHNRPSDLPTHNAHDLTHKHYTSTYIINVTAVVRKHWGHDETVVNVGCHNLYRMP